MHSGVVSLFLLLSCMVSMHACNARRLGISSFSFKDQKLLRRYSKSSSTEVHLEGESREMVTDPKNYSSTGNVAIVSPSSSQSHQIISHATECKASSRLLVEVMEPAGLRDNAVDNNIVDAVESNVGEDIAVMDYAQPHRKPPIHNEKP